MVALPLADRGMRQKAGAISWLLVAIAVTPPAVVMLHPGVNLASDVALHRGLRIATPEIRMFGRVVIPSKTLWELEPVIQPASNGHPFTPLAVAAPYFLDESPPGSYDFTLIDPATDSDVVAVPSPCSGEVIETGYSAGYGHFLEVSCEAGHRFFMAHFAELQVTTGAQVVKGSPLAIQGSTGNSTGPHVHAEITPASGERTNRAETLPIMEAAIAFWQAGQAPPLEPLSLGESPLTNEELKAAIGNAEGTANIDGTPNHNYFGHVDPGNGARNLGFFSYQHGAATPEAADQKQLQRLRNAEQTIQAQAVNKFGQPLSEAALLAALDLWNQAPLAGQDFVQHLSTHDPSPEQIVAARSKAFVDPVTGTLNAPGLGNTWQGVAVDQRRRTEEALATLEYLQKAQ